MIAQVDSISTLQDRFLEMLPQMRRQARFAFRSEPPGRRYDLVMEAIDSAWVAFVDLVKRGMLDIIYPSPLIRYAIKRIRDGRGVGVHVNINDVSSSRCQRAKGFVMERLDRFNSRHRSWRELLVEDRHAGPAETAAARIDVSDWLDLLPKRRRKIAEALATGETTQRAAKRFRVTPGRISQMRRELQQDWQEFHGEAAFA